MSLNPNENAAEVPGPSVRNGEKLAGGITTPGELAETYNFVVVTSSEPEAGGRLWPVKDLGGNTVGFLPGLKGLRDHYYGVYGAPQLYVGVSIARSYGLPFMEGRRDTLERRPVARLVDISRIRLGAPNHKDPMQPTKSVEHVGWREKGRRLVGAVAVASLLLVAGLLGSNGAKQKEPSPPAAVSVQENITSAFPSTSDIFSLPSGEAKGPNPTTPVLDAETIKDEQHKPSITPDYDAPTVWAMFARVTGKAYAQTAILDCANKLGQSNYLVTYHGNPAKDKTWWITITGPNGKKYTSDKEVAQLLASVS